MQRIVTRTLAVVLGLGLFCGLSACSTKTNNWKFTDSQGEIRELSDYKGQIVVISFSNTWCDPCKEAAPFMQELQERFGQHGVKVMTVSSWEQGDPQQWMLERGYTYGVMLNGTEVARGHKVDQIPTFLVVGVNGKVIYRHDGFSKRTAGKLTKVVDKHLKKHVGSSYAQHSG